MIPRRSNLSRGFLVLLLTALGFGSLAAQTGRITGRIVDSDGQPLSDVQISLDDTNIGTLSNQEGRYLLLNVPVGIYTVTAQLIGYATRHATNVRVTADEQAIVDFTMPMKALVMEELVVTGTVDPIEGIKVPFTVGKVSTENMAVPTTQSALASIQGKVAGVQVVRGSGQPGQGVNILLRTPTSVERSNTPMFVVDGVILSSTIGGTTVDLESLDIESVEVVKGAAAASLYGSRAASGVIQITTKRGDHLAMDQTQIKVRSEMGTSQLPHKIPTSRKHHYLQAEDGTWVDADGNQVSRTARVIDPNGFMDNPYRTPLYDNFDAVFDPDLFHINTISVAKNSLSTNFLASFTNYDERGNYPGNEGFQRRSFRLNVDHRIGDDFNVSASAFHSRSVQDDLESDPFWDLLVEFEPDIDLSRKDENGQYLQVPDSTLPAESPLFQEAVSDDFDNRTRTLISTDVRWRPLTGISLNSNVSYDRGHVFYDNYRPKGIPPGPNDLEASRGWMMHQHSQSNALNGYVSGTYTRAFGPLTTRTTLRAVLERERYDYTVAESENMAVIDVRDLDIGIDRDVGSSVTEIRSTGYLAQVGLDWNGKYIVDILGRRDGSSLFGPDARWNNYYRVATSYRMAQEPWWPFAGINEFKLRYAIGTAGGRPSFSDQYETWSVSTDASGNTTVGKSTLGNRLLKPEFTTEQDFGVDMIFNNTYSLQLSYITQRTEDLLIGVPLPAVTGYPSQMLNTGVQSGHTIEATLEAQLINSQDLSWSMDFVADRSRSTIEEWNRSCYFSGLRQICDGTGLGQMWGERFLTSVDQLPEQLQPMADEFQVNDEGYLVWVGQGNSWKDGVSKDLWGTSFTDEMGINYSWGLPVLERDSLGIPTVTKIGRSEPSLGFGWMNNLRWKNLNLHAHLQGQLGGNIYSGSRQRMYQHMRHKDLDQTGRPDFKKKPIDYYQAIYNKNNNTRAFVEPGWYMKLRTLSASYSFGPSLLQRVRLDATGITQIDLGVIARNLLTFTDYRGWDPEAGSVLQRYESPYTYPKMRQITAYMEVAF